MDSEARVAQITSWQVRPVSLTSGSADANHAESTCVQLVYRLMSLHLRCKSC